MLFDSTDLKILELLQEDNRMSFREIAKRINVTTPTVISRVEVFKELKLIESFGIKLNAELLNEITILMQIECKPSDIGKIMKRLKEKDQVRELYCTDGARIFSKVTVGSIADLRVFLQQLSDLEEITTFKYSTITETVKELPRAIIHDGLNLTVNCYYCRKPILEKPVKIKLDGKDHFLCCNVCASHYKEKYAKLKEKAKKK